MRRNSLTAISLFCGCGGADLGLIGGFNYLGKEYKTNNIEIIHASDINIKAVNTYNINFKNKAICEDVLNLNFNSYKADLLVGGFPCQNFSTVNPNKNPEDKNNQLFWELAKVTEQVKPRIVIGENVKGFYYLKSGKYFNMIKNRLEDLGYNVYAEILNAANYGIPQLRQRIVIIGVRNDIKKEFKFPEPISGENSKTKRRNVVLKDVIESIVPKENKYYFSQRAVTGAKNAKPNMKRALAQDLEKPCLTITSHLAKVSINSRDPVLLVDKDRELYRRFTPEEAARIQSFPDSFQFSGSESDAYRQIGNAVPPVMFWYLAQEIKNVLKE